MSAPCPICHGTGEKGHYGIPDCDAPDCTAATERATLNAAIQKLGPLSVYDVVWQAYLLGKKACFQ